MVRIHLARNHSSFYLIADVQSSSSTRSIIWILHQEEKILPVHGITEDPMESTLVQVVETYP